MALKQDTRASVLARRKAIPDVKRKEKSRLICERFLAEIDNRIAGEAPSCASAKQLHIAAYEPMTSEVDVHPLLFAAYERDWEVFLPCMAKDAPDAPSHMVFFPITQNHLTKQRPAFLDHPARPYLLDDLHAQAGGKPMSSCSTSPSSPWWPLTAASCASGTAAGITTGSFPNCVMTAS